MRIVLNLQINLGRTDTFIRSRLSTYSHNMSPHFDFISSVNILKISAYRSLYVLSDAAKYFI